MMIKPCDKEIQIIDKITPWVIPGESDGDLPTIKPEAPEDIKVLFEKWLKGNY